MITLDHPTCCTLLPLFYNYLIPNLTTKHSSRICKCKFTSRLLIEWASKLNNRIYYSWLLRRITIIVKIDEFLIHSISTVDISYAVDVLMSTSSKKAPGKCEKLKKCSNKNQLFTNHHQIQFIVVEHLIFTLIHFIYALITSFLLWRINDISSSKSKKMCV